MSYSPVKQGPADPPAASYHDLTLDTAPSPGLTDAPSAPFSPSLDNLLGEGNGDDTNVRTDNGESKVSRFISSLTSSSRQSYDLVEDDDYETAEQVTPTLERHSKSATTGMANSPFARQDLPIRTASISGQLPLNHPMPDLQSLQGAYVKNVVRLEESAERLSTRSSIEGDRRGLHDEQWRGGAAMSSPSPVSSIRSGSLHQVSTRSLERRARDVSTGARPGEYISASPLASPIGSLKSPPSAQQTSGKRMSKSSRLSQALPEPEFEGRPLDSDLAQPQPRETVNLDPRPARSPSLSDASQLERPTTSGSGDTYQQARVLFTDFDGVHYSPDRTQRGMRRISLSRPPRARDSRAFREPQPGEEMIYYPAPVPVMLNLPMRLSRMNWSEQEKKRLQALSNIPDDMRKSAAWLANEEGVPSSNSRHSKLPPQLRASAFFDHRGTTQEVQLKDGSAVATLDSILDAAAHAPVSAFTDHPIAGYLGNDFYSAEQPKRKSVQMPSEKDKKSKRKSSMSNLLKARRRSSGNMSEAMARESRVPSVLLSGRDNDQQSEEAIEDEAEQSMAPDNDEIPNQQSEHGEDTGGSDTDSESQASQLRPGFSAAPTTLLAELQMRKAQQRLRNRTAADAFPNGMHSTLLELDTVTQLQLKARRQKHVKLAWEDTDVVDKENFDDDEIPLGVLFPEKEQQSHVNLNRPMGLMEKKELEENEPLSHRRARLRGEPLAPPVDSRSMGMSQQAEQADKPMLDLPDLGGSGIANQDEEEETLAQRKQRIRNQKEHGAAADFAQQLTAELGLKAEADAPAHTTSKTPDVEETLGQRRKRLQAEAHNRNVGAGNQNNRPILRTKKSLADILQAHPIGYVDPNQKTTAQLVMQNQERAREREAQFIAAQEAEKYEALASRNRFGHGHNGGLIQNPSYNHPGYQQSYTGIPGIGMSHGHGLNASQPGYGYGSMPNLAIPAPHANGAVPVTNLPNNHPYQHPMMQGYGYQSAIDMSGMGPPLDQKQRARIEGWRQGIM